MNSFLNKLKIAYGSRWGDVVEEVGHSNRGEEYRS